MYNKFMYKIYEGQDFPFPLNISLLANKSLGIEMKKPNLRFVKIKFDTQVFDKIEKDRAAKFVDQLSAIGGTMGLLTGFSVISGVEIIYFAAKIVLTYFGKMKAKLHKKF